MGKLAEKSVEVLRGELAGKMAKTAFAEEVLFSVKMSLSFLKFA